MRSYWVPIIEGAAPVNRTQDPPVRVSRLYDILSPISPEEVLSCLPSANTSPGPDGFPVRLWKRIPIPLLAYSTWETPAGSFHLNFQLPVPSSYRKRVTPRVRKTTVRFRSPRWRSGTIIEFWLTAWRVSRLSTQGSARSEVRMELRRTSSCFVRCFGTPARLIRVSASRLSTCRRRLIQFHTSQLTPRCVARAYAQCSRALLVLKCVRQLSPLLFNVVVDHAPRAIPHADGYTLGSEQVSALAFADDVILVASTPLGLQRSCEAFTDRVSVDGLKLNPAKSATLTQIPRLAAITS
ncbi:Reverse transcriptase domain [Cinara cedri]|uniref:Reverse transcriptase domain n=1 Tax=Cinara cedri TaxID=506608 RepID=A0A5E4N2T6_9HEMI|nr:Reverse transcriptase domain [Cinara cedri]